MPARPVRLIAFTRGAKHTGVVVGGRLTVLVLWSLWWWRQRAWAPLVWVGSAGGSYVCRVGPLVVNWLAVVRRPLAAGRPREGVPPGVTLSGGDGEGRADG